MSERVEEIRADLPKRFWTLLQDKEDFRFLLAEIDRLEAEVEDKEGFVTLTLTTEERIRATGIYGLWQKMTGRSENTWPDKVGYHKWAVETITNLKAENQRLRDAAKPFVEIETGNYFWKTRLSLVNEDAEYIHGSVSIGDLRALAEAVIDTT
jgi:hypothetical protein